MNGKLIIDAFSKLNSAWLIDNNLLNDVKLEFLSNFFENQSVQNKQDVYILSNLEPMEICKKIEELLKNQLISKTLFDRLTKSILSNYYRLENQFGNNWLERYLNGEINLQLQQPIVQQPVYQQPVNSQPVYQQPVYQQPINSQPAYQQPQQPVNNYPNQLQNNYQMNNGYNNPQPSFANATLNKDMLNLPPVLTIENLTKKYKGKDKPAINKISFNVFPGQFHAFIGANGAGKTTTIKSIIDAYSKYNLSGSIKIGNHPNYTAEAKRLVGYIPEAANFPKKMKTGDYLISMCMLDGFRKKDAEIITKDVLNRLGLINLINQRPASFSSGQKKKILLAQALIHKPSLLVLDEPAANLDPLARDELFETLVTLQKEGTAIFISSHILDEIARFATYVTILDGGEIVYNSPIETHTNLNELYKHYVKKGSVDLMIH